MEKELEAQFIKRFPTFFRDMYGDEMKTCMHWGIDFGIGWKDILWAACVKIEQVIAESDPKPDFKFEQLKEKFSTMRAYYSGGNEKIDKIIYHLEELSGHVCESCGTDQDVTSEGPGWIRTLCKKCRGEDNVHVSTKHTSDVINLLNIGTIDDNTKTS